MRQLSKFRHGFCRRWGLVFIFFLHHVPYAEGGGLEARLKRPDNVAVHVSWEKENEVKVCKGSFSLKTVGDMALESLQEKTHTIFQKYSDASGTANYHYEIQCVEKEPDPPYKGCPMLYELHGSGPSPFLRSDLYIHNFGDPLLPQMLATGTGAQQFLALLQQAPQVAHRYYEYAVSFGTRTMYGRRRSSIHPCQYDDFQHKVSLGGVGLRFNLPEKGEMRGYRHWQAKSEDENPSFKITLSDLPPTMEKQPYKPPQAGDGEASYIVSWNFDDCACLPYVEPSPTTQSTDKEPSVWEDMAKQYGCVAADNLLFQDLALLEAYADMNLRDQADPDKIGNYNNNVGKRAYDIWNHNRGSTPVEWPHSLKMGVDPNDCTMENVEEAKELAKQLCLPDIIFEQILAHEQLHVDQCLTYKKFGKKITASSFGRDETHAYARGVEMTLKWLEKNCEQTLKKDIAKARERLAVVKNSEGYTGF